MTCVKDCKCVMKYHQNEYVDDVPCEIHPKFKTIFSVKCKCVKCKHPYFIVNKSGCGECIIEESCHQRDMELQKIKDEKNKKITDEENKIIESRLGRYFTVQEFNNLNQLVKICRISRNGTGICCTDNHYADNDGNKYHGKYRLSLNGKILLLFGLH